MPTCKELGVGVVAYSPLGRGFFGGVNTKELDKRDWRQNQERLQGETGTKNAKMLKELQQSSTKSLPRACGHS
jgi:aryl-alcohol dehydrogenase-like predicted oxidoreductase